MGKRKACNIEEAVNGMSERNRRFLLSNNLRRMEEADSTSVDGNPRVVLEKLMKEETSLKQEKRELTALKKELWPKAMERCEITIERIQKLKNEVSALRQQCEELRRYVSQTFEQGKQIHE